MKTKQKFSLLLVVILFMVGCVQSLHPLYHKKDRVEVPEIVGKWQDMDSENIWEFRKVDGEPSYILSYFEKEEAEGNYLAKDSANILVNIVKLGGSYFMDLYPGNNENLDNLNDLLEFHVLRVHTFAKLEIVDGKPHIRHMDPDWLEKLFKENKIRIKHEIVVVEAEVNAPDNVFKSPITHGNIILTASTDNLQKFITKYADDEAAFMEATVLTPYDK